MVKGLVGAIVTGTLLGAIPRRPDLVAWMKTREGEEFLRAIIMLSPKEDIEGATAFLIGYVAQQLAG